MAKKVSNLDELKQDIKNKSPRQLYVLFGEEQYGKKLYLKKLSDLIDDGGFEDFNRVVIDSSKSFADYDDALESFPMMSEKKLVIIRDSGIFVKASEESKDFWSERLSNLPEYCVVIFDETSVDKRSSLYKTAAKFGLCVEFEYMEKTDLISWVVRQAMQENIKMSKDTAQYFVSMLDDGMQNAKNELDKLICFCEGEITKNDIDRLVSKAVGVRIFDLTDCIMAKNAHGALKILSDLNTANEPPIRILLTLSQAFDKMLKSLLLLAEGMNYSEISRELSVTPYIAQKYVNSAKGFGESYLIDRITEATMADYSIKTGNVTDSDALENFVLDCLKKITN